VYFLYRTFVFDLLISFFVFRVIVLEKKKTIIILVFTNRCRQFSFLECSIFFKFTVGIRRQIKPDLDGFNDKFKLGFNVQPTHVS
jgi:hypothetical protein